MARTKAVVLRLSEEEYNLLKELSGREPMNAYLRRVALDPADAFDWKPAKPISAEAFDWFKCPVGGCDFKAASSAARCPDHGRTVIMAP